MLGQYVVDIELSIQVTINADKGQLYIMNDGSPDAQITVSSVHILTDVYFNITFVPSSITKVPVVFVGNLEAGLIRKKEMQPLNTFSPMMCHCPLHPGLLIFLCETMF